MSAFKDMNVSLLAGNLMLAMEAFASDYYASLLKYYYCLLIIRSPDLIVSDFSTSLKMVALY